MKKFSVIIPHYNNSGTLSKCLHSVFDQDYPEKEVIVVFDSEDKTAELIVKSFKGVITAKTAKERSGAPVARNMGADLATGDYLLFLDADSYLTPGALRTWAETFEDALDCDFLYSGYKVLSTTQDNGMAYPSEEFDSYHLSRYNYIDTSNPLRKSALVPWDENLRSFQDWDFWIRVVKNGHKGKFLKNAYFVDKEPPSKDSISQDSHDNWVARRKTILEKHNIPKSEIAVTSFAAVHHGRRVAKLIGADYCDPIILRSKPHEYKLVYLVGCFPENGMGNWLPFYDSVSSYFKKGLINVVQWIGTDVLHTGRVSFSALKDCKDGFNKRFVQLCQSEDNLKELTSMGFNVKLLSMPIQIDAASSLPLPKDFTVAIYDHGNSQEDIYCLPLMRDIIQSMPDIQFIYFGSDVMKGEDHNCKFLGHGVIDEIIAQSSCLLRITRHDGFPVTPIEFLNHNRPTVTNVNMQHVYKVDFNGKLTDQNVPRVKREIVKHIRDIQRKDTIDYKKAKTFYADYFNPIHLKNELENLIKKGEGTK